MRKAIILIGIVLSLVGVNVIPAQAAVPTITSLTVSNISKGGAHFHCGFTISSGTWYVRFFSYRTSDRAQQQITNAPAFGPGPHAIGVDRVLLSAGTQYTVWCQVLASPNATTATVKKYTHFYTRDATDGASVGNG